MKILLVSEYIHNTNGYTLVPRYLCRELKRAGFDAKILTTGKLPTKLLDGESREDFIFTTNIEVLFNKQNVIKKIKEFNPDVIHTNGLSRQDLLCISYAKKNKLILLTTLHTRITPFLRDFLPLGGLWPRFILDIIKSRIINNIKKADIVIALTPEMREYLYSNGCKTVEIISNGVDLENFKIRPPMSEDQKVINLLYVGNIEKRKNQTYLLEVAKNLPDNYILNLVGGLSQNKEYFELFNLKLEEYLKLRNNVINHGRVDISKINELYQKSDLFISASLLEAQSLVLIEAIASGLLIIRLAGRDSTGVTDHFYNAIHLKDTTMPESFAKTIQVVATNYPLYKELYDNTIKSRDTYSWERNAKKYINMITFYKSLNH